MSLLMYLRSTYEWGGVRGREQEERKGAAAYSTETRGASGRGDATVHESVEGGATSATVEQTQT